MNDTMDADGNLKWSEPSSEPWQISRVRDQVLRILIQLPLNSTKRPEGTDLDNKSMDGWMNDGEWNTFPVRPRRSRYGFHSNIKLEGVYSVFPPIPIYILHQVLNRDERK